MYANHFEVSQSIHEFSIVAARAPSRVSTDMIELLRGGNPVPINAQVQLLIPPTVVPRLIVALQRQVEKYVEQHGQINAARGARDV
jgi:hypothetical protein